MTTYYTQAIAGCFVADSSRDSRATILDNPNISLSDPGTWEQIFGTSIGTDSGIPVTPTKALTCSAVWQAVNLISGDVAKLPIMVYRSRYEDGTEYLQPQPEHPLSWRLGWQPNKEDSAVDFWQRVMVHALLWTNAYIYIADDGDLLTLLPDRTIPARADGELFYATEADGRMVPILAEKVMHIRGITIDGMADLPLIQQARNAIALALAQEKFASKFFANGGRIGGILELPAGMSKPTRDSVEEGFRKSYEGADNPFKTVILRENAKFHAAQMSPVDSQLVEGTEAQVRQIARFFNLPPAKLNIKDASAYNAIEQANQAYLDQTLAIWLRKITAQCELKLLSSREQALYQIRHDVAELLKMDPLKQIQMGEIGIRSRVLSPNEVRAKLNYPPYDGGDEYGDPAAEAIATGTQAEQGSDAGQEDDGTEDDSAQEASADRQWIVRRIVFSLAARARHKAKNPQAFLSWVDSQLKDHRDEWQSITGGVDEPTFFIDYHAALEKIAETTTATDLPARVDELVTTWERSV